MKFIKKITQTDIFKITTLNSFSVLIKIGIGLVTSKVLAVFVGPAGMALVGNFRNFVTSLESIATLGFQTGIVKYVADSKDDNTELKKVLSTVFISLIITALILSSVLYFFASFWSFKILGINPEYVFIFKVTALALPWYAISIFLISVINGLGLFKKVIWISIIGNILGLAVSLFLVINYQTLGALLAIIVTPALLFFINFYSINKEIPFLDFISLSFFDFKVIKNLSSYSLMVLVSAFLVPIVYIAIRNTVIHKIGIEEAGFWETMTRISSYYLLFSSTILTIYFYPKLVEAKTNLETKEVFWSYYKTILPPFIIGLFCLYFSRYFIIRILFTKDFSPVADLFFWQLVGDVFKVASLILGFQFLAKKMTKAYIIFEILSLLFLYFASTYLMVLLGIQGVVMAQALDNFLYFLVLSIYFRKSLLG